MPRYSREEIQLLAQLSPLLAMSLSVQQGRDDMAVKAAGAYAERPQFVPSLEQKQKDAYRASQDDLDRALGVIEPYKIKQSVPRYREIGIWNGDSSDKRLQVQARALTKDVNAYLTKLRTARIVWFARQALRDDPETLDQIRRRGTTTIEPDELYESVMADMVALVIAPIDPVTCYIEAMYRAAMKRSVDEDRFDIEDDDRIPLDFMECITHTLEPHEHHVLFAER